MQKQKVYLSKYALSTGIIECMAEIKRGRAYPGKPYSDFIGFTMGTDAHETKEAALSVAEGMRVKKLASLKKQLSGLENKKFKIVVQGADEPSPATDDGPQP